MTRKASLVTRIFGGCLLALFISGCGSKQPVTYYNLTPLPSAQPRPRPSETHPPMAIGIGPVQLPDALSRVQIAARLNPQRLKYDDSQRWSGSLSDDFVVVLTEDIAARLPEQATVAAFPWGSYFQPSHRLVLNVSRFDGTPGAEVELSARWTITDSSGKETLLSRKSTLQVKVTGDDFQSLVTAHSQALADLAQEIATALVEP